MSEKNTENETLKKRAEEAEKLIADLKQQLAAKEGEKSEVETLKRQLADATAKIKDFQTKIDSDAEAKQAKEIEDLKTKLAEANAAIRSAKTEKAFHEKAAELKAANPAKLFALVGGKLEFDEKGEIKNLKEVFETAQKDYAEEFGAVAGKKVSIDGGAKDSTDTAENLSAREQLRAAYADTGK